MRGMNELKREHMERTTFQEDPAMPSNKEIDFPLVEVPVPVLTMDNPRIKGGFPFWERIGTNCMGCARCCGSQDHFVSRGFSSTVMKAETGEITEKMRMILDQFHERVVYLKIHDTGGLELDPNLIHPFVRIHVIDLNTDSYKAKTHAHGVVAYHEKIGQIDATKTYHSGNSNFIVPFATPPCDLRVNGENDPHWDEEFILDDDAYSVLSPSTVFLFEILDFNFKLVRQHSKLLRNDKMYPIAWGFLRPVGSCKMHLGSSKVQLYRYKYKAPVGFNEIHRPEVFYNFNWYNKTKYPSFLRVEMHVMPAPNMTRELYSLSPFQEEVGEKSWEELENEAERPTAKGNQDISKEYLDKQKKLSRWKKLPNEDCRIPNSLAGKFDSSEMGCWRLSFSHSGKYLAAGCTDNKTVIRIYNIEDMEQIMVLKGHADLIHDIVWSDFDNYLLTCSTDGTAKLWTFAEVMDHGMEITGMTSSNFNPGTAQFLRHNIQHPSYVYAAVFHPDQSYPNVFFIATACFDGYVRLWLSTPDGLGKTNELSIIPQIPSKYEVLGNSSNQTKDLKMLAHRHPNCLVFGKEDILYVGDSLGMIHIFEIRIRNNLMQPQLIRQVELDEMLGDPINIINLKPDDDRMLLVQSRDNVIRGLEPPKDVRDDHTLIYKRFFGPRCNKFNIRSCVSPDGQYLLSGSEDGKLYLWDITTEIRMEIGNLEVNIKDIISDVAWNPVYNMFAVAGFGPNLPIILYVYQKTTEEIEENYANPQIAYERQEYLVPNKEVLSDLAYEIHGNLNY